LASLAAGSTCDRAMNAASAAGTSGAKSARNKLGSRYKKPSGVGLIALLAGGIFVISVFKLSPASGANAET
jgi:hypothetical protein